MARHQEAGGHLQATLHSSPLCKPEDPGSPAFHPTEDIPSAQLASPASPPRLAWLDFTKPDEGICLFPKNFPNEFTSSFPSHSVQHTSVPSASPGLGQTDLLPTQCPWKALGLLTCRWPVRGCTQQVLNNH